MTELEKFILEYENTDAASLLLRKVQWPSLDKRFDGFSSKDILANTIDGRKKIKSKVPSWYSNIEILYPTRLCTEQCSSSATASIKADLLKRILSTVNNKTVADLTSGLGVDVWAFAQIADRVLYNDMDPVLVAASRHNFSILGISNVDHSNVKVEPGNLCSILKEGWTNPGVIFLDPARRDSAGKKVFLLEDCQPDVLSLMDELLSASRNIVLKLSPMADISMVCERLSKANAPVKEVHVVAAGSECKELLIWIDATKDNDNTYSLTIHESDKVITCNNLTESSSKANLFENKGDILDGKMKYLFEPGKAITKAGLFNYISQEFGLVKAGRSSHLYFCSEENLDSISGFGKVFKISSSMIFNGKSIKEISSTVKEAEVTSRNLPISSDELRKKLKVKSSSSVHIFAFKADFNNDKSEQFILVTQRL